MSESEKQTGTTKLGVSFHRTFALSRPSVAQVLRIALDHSGSGDGGERLGFDGIRAGTSLGSVYVEAMPRYARGAGLIDARSRPTLFGELVASHDTNLTLLQTQWLMHYFLSAPHHGGPVFWAHTVTTAVRVGETLDRQYVSSAIEEYLSQAGAGSIGKSTIDEAATAFIGTYWKEDALGPLGILSPVQGSRNLYSVNEPEEPNSSVFAYVLADYWDGMWPGRKTVNLEAVTSELGGPASLLLLGTGQANRLLRSMQEQGWVQVQRRAAPYTVVRLWEDSSVFLERLYD
jgi:hypothetical protein